MATLIKVKRLSNPRRVSVRRKRTAARRKMSPKQIRIFGTPAQKAALRRRTGGSAKRKRVVVSRPRRRSTRAARNPALVVTLGAANPRRKRSRTNMARTRRRRAANTRRRRTVTVRRRRRASNPTRARRHVRRRRRNPTRIVVIRPRRNRRRVSYRRRRANGHRRRVYRHRRNPAVFGHSITSKSGLKLIGGGVIGVTAAKFIPTMIPAQLTMGMGSTGIGRVILTGAAAVFAGWAAGKMDTQFGEGVLFGGLMQTASVALNVFLPGFSIGGVPIGMGDLMPGQFVVPQNPIRAAIPPPPPTNARMTMNGLARSFGTAF